MVAMVLVSSLPVTAGRLLPAVVLVRGLDHRVRERVQLHGRRQRDLRGARPDRGRASTPCLGWWRHDGFLVPVGAAVAVGALAFLPWNAGRARVFLGDAGSYALGAALAMLAAYAVVHGIPAEAALGPLALYLADTAWTLQRRIRAGERWLEAHRTHVYQQWCDAGWSHQRVTLAAAAGTFLLSLLGAASLTGDPAAAGRRRPGRPRGVSAWPTCRSPALLAPARSPGLRDREA